MTHTPSNTEIAVTPATAPEPKIHHKFGPSRMNFLSKCSAFSSSGESSAAADAGTELHDVMERCVAAVCKGGFKTTRLALDSVIDFLLKSDKTEVSEQDRAYLIFCCNKIDSLLARGPSEIITERNVRVSGSDNRELNHGTLDLLLVFGKIAVLIDYKFGWIPVTSAKDNLQGKNYVAGVLQVFRDINTVVSCFIQPKLGVISEHVFVRSQLPKIIQELEEIVEDAIFVQNNPDAPEVPNLLNPGQYCAYCSLSGSCASLANHRQTAAAAFCNLPVPTQVNGLELASPSQIALARYWVDIIENGIDGVKKLAFETAKANGGELSCTLPSGEIITYEIQSRGCDRVLSSAIEVSEALADMITPAEILGAAELSIGKLEKICRSSVQELFKARGEKMTKKAAWEMVESTLSAHGLLSKPDTKIEYLKQRTNK
jgi:hypothetical protein